MRRFFLAAVAIVASCVVFGQDKDIENMKKEAAKEFQKNPEDTIPKIWRVGGLFTLNFNQAALSNWAAGGENSALSFNSLLSLHAFYKKNRDAWDNTLDLAYGGLSSTTQGKRKTDDRIDLLSRYGYEIAKKWYLSALFNFRTQFAKGYNYPSANTKVLTSDFLSPAYVLLSPGIMYKPNDEFAAFISPATARWVIVRNDTLASIGAFGVDSGKNVKFELGAFASFTYNKKISANSVYTGRLDFFSNYLHDPQNIDIYMTNLLVVKVTKIISMTFSLNLIYDNDIKTVKSDGTSGGAALQLQEVLGIGLSLKF
ncbi:MAG: hypothetical protein C5B59_06415 [Bacteroidetes bacterium]|nr:MAG: hypothetical protein C5B59_06415 [Bacteroidota bacterium]